MNFGPLCSRKPIKPGSGSRCAERPAKLSRMRLATGVKRPVDNYGVLSHKSIDKERVIATFGPPMRLLFQKSSMKQLAKRVVKQRMLSAGIIHSDSDWRGLSVKPYLSPNRCSFTISVFVCFYTATIET